MRWSSHHTCRRPCPPPVPSQDYINFRLTGRMCASVNNVSARWHYDTQRGWPRTLLQHLGMPELLDKWPKEVLALSTCPWLGRVTLPCTGALGGDSRTLSECPTAPDWPPLCPHCSWLAAADVVGGLTQEAAAHLGLAPCTPVAQGGVDAQIGMLGLGVVDPGSLALLMGSSHLHLGVTNEM